MNPLQLTSAIVLLSSTLLVTTACSSHKPTPDTAYTPRQEAAPHPVPETVAVITPETTQDINTPTPRPEPLAQAELEPLPDLPPELMADDQETMDTVDVVAPTVEDTRPAKTLFLFGFDQKQLDDQGETLLREHGRFLASHPEMKIHINGHADPQGDANYNRHLAQQRAEYVADLLQQEGVSQAQLEVTSWGAEAPSASATHHRDNRRVELVYDEEYLVNYQSE
ncbi:OmpA family protein [Ketobacter sp.]|uniref:OmpA family protein n=1 Tax=Ketobacter sp. TaxID=2083498 RepID=UPI0025B9597D|nr:OmpA family protein [Ketobacter sp.]